MALRRGLVGVLISGAMFAAGVLLLATGAAPVEWSTHVSSGSEGPLPFESSRFYHLVVSDGCDNHASFPVRMTIVDAASNETLEDMTVTAAASSDTCRVAASFEFNVPRDGAFEVRWSMGTDFAGRSPTFKLYAGYAPAGADTIMVMLGGLMLAAWLNVLRQRKPPVDVPALPPAHVAAQPRIVEEGPDRGGAARPRIVKEDSGRAGPPP